MIDARGRNIEYLRLSVTNRCNLNCIYCDPSAAKCEMLTAEEISRVVAVMASLGIRKIRVTGGEPLLRRDIVDIVRGVAKIPGIDEVPLTTNGIGLAKMIGPLKEAGLSRLNISLDSVNRETYRDITGKDKLDSVLLGIRVSIEMGVGVKVNCVLVRGINDGEIDDLVALAKDMPISVRFIELMPIGRFGEDNHDKVVRGDEILAKYPQLFPDGKDSGGVASVYRLPGHVGTLGLISPVTHKFCNECNRVRLTCDGRIKPCLGDNGEVDLLSVLRGGGDLEGVIRQAIYNKPEGHNFSRGFSSKRSMGDIGG